MPIRLVQAGLLVSILMLAAAPLAVPDSYSLIDNTLSESGAQGIAGAWVFRLGILFASASVLAMVWAASQSWNSAARWWLGLYAAALILLVVLPEAPWDGSPYNPMMALGHTAAGVVGVISFVLGIRAVSDSRPARRLVTRIFDWTVIATVVLMPQVMLIAPADGVLQRLMVTLGYAWLLSESSRMSGEAGPSSAAS